MAIEEKQRALEFVYVPDDVEGDIKYEISYDESKGKFPLSISTGGNGINYPLELFTEVVEFLSGKGIIESKVLSRTVPSPGSGIPSGPFSPPTAISASALLPTTSIPVSQVVKGMGGDTSVSSNVDPLASFDITSQSPVTIPQPNIGTSVPNGSPPIPQIVKGDDGGIVMHSPAPATTFSAMPDIPVMPVDPALAVPPPAAAPEMINRPVIRTRVNDVDPQSAEKEAAMLRAAQGKGAGKTVRKAHRAEGE